MAKKMLINSMHPEEARVAIVEDGHLVELDIETAGREQTRGNVYKGLVVRVEPGLQAAFVDIGLKKLGFMQMGEIHPDSWQWRDDIPKEQRNRRPRIQEILRRGQELIVQVEKGERDAKGAALTTYISLPGRYMVLMPGSDSCGISRKVEVEAERKKLKEIIAELEIPEGYGYIIRTEAVDKRKTELAKDLDYLVKLYENIKERAGETKAPALIYQESDLVIRTIRDYFNADIEEVLVDSKDVYKQARAFFKEIMPKYEKLVKLHQEKRSIFAKYQIEEQIDLIYEKKVPLKSGGSIVIEPTEALVSIDVNSGKSTGERGIEDTAFKTNMEAAEEVARQLRLRDLGGLIIIDFIDMRDRKHKAEVEKTLKNALKADKARVSVDKISQFGLLEMSRQRIKQTINEASYLECPHCGGHGKVKSVEAMALSFLRKVHTAAARGVIAEVRGGLPLEVAYYLLNRKKRELTQIENEYDIEITVKGKPSFMMNEMELDLAKREKQPVQEAGRSHPMEGDVGEYEPAEQGEEPESEAAAPDTVESKSKRKRRRGKKKPATAADTAPAEGEITGLEPADSPGEPVASDEFFEMETEQDDTGSTATLPADQEAAGETVKKKRRRRRKRPKTQAGTDGAVTDQEGPPETESARMVATDSAAEASPDEPCAPTEPPAQEKPKRAPRKPRSAKVPAAERPLAEGSETSEPAVPPALTDQSQPEGSASPTTVTSGEVAPAEKPKPKRAPRKKAGPATGDANEPGDS